MYGYSRKIVVSAVDGTVVGTDPPRPANTRFGAINLNNEMLG